MMSKVLYASMAALLVSGVAAEHHVETHVTNVASASASSASLAEPGFVEAVTSTHTFAEGDDALAEAGALALASGEDWWGGADAAALSESVTLIEDGGIFVGALAEDEADQYGDWTAFAEADAVADGAVVVFKKYWEPEPEPAPEPVPEPCDGWWCHEPEPAPEPVPEPCDGWWCHEDDSRRSLKEHHVESHVTNVASASASSASLAEPGFVEAVTSTHTFAEGDDALAEAGALALASGEDWWGGADAAALSESVTLIEDGGIYVGALAEDEADQYGDWTAFAEADAVADGAVVVFKKYWEPEPEPVPEPVPEPCDGWWCHEPEPVPEPVPEPCDGWWCHEDDSRRSLKEHHVETHVTNVASASASSASLAEPGFVEAVTSTHTFAEGDDALAEAGALALASGEDWWGGADAAALSESVTLIEDGGIFVGALAEDEADQYGDWTAFAEADAVADGAVVVFKKYWEPEPEPVPEPVPEPCDGWWCHEPEPVPEPVPEPCDGWWCHEDDSK